tara:strand:+ start:3591 stop:3986 length:396 start_codon:yes stop_codon:yes gene_type:complete
MPALKTLIAFKNTKHTMRYWGGLGKLLRMPEGFSLKVTMSIVFIVLVLTVVLGMHFTGLGIKKNFSTGTPLSGTKTADTKGCSESDKSFSVMGLQQAHQQYEKKPALLRANTGATSTVTPIVPHSPVLLKE